MVVPVTAVWATRFEVFRLAGSLDTFIPLVSTALLATNPFYALIYAWSFGGIPDTQLEAARLEGASGWRVWREVAMPQARPATLAVAVLAFTFHWGNFIDALLYLNSQELFTLPVGLRFLQLLNPTDYPLLLAGSVIVTIPPVLVFLLAQQVLLDPLRATRRDRGSPRRSRRAAAVATAVGLLAVACGGDGDGGTGTTRLSFVLFGDPVETAGYRTLIERFEAANPDITVSLEPSATQDDLLAELTTRFAGGAPPDVFLLNFRRYGQFADQGAIEPVQSYLEASDAISTEDFSPVAFDAFRFDGEELTCMPQNLSSLVVYYNQDLFEEAGVDPPEAEWTWDDFLAAAQALTDPEADVYGVGVEPNLIRVAPFVWSNGGELVDDQDAPTRLTLDDGAAREALDWFLDLNLEHGVTPDDRAEQAEGSEERFLAGRLGMYLNSRRVVPTLRTITDFSWDVAPLPVAPLGQPATVLHSDAYCMSAGSDHHEEAWRFIEFAMGQEGQELLAESGRTVPSRLDVARSDAFLDPDQPPASAEVFLDSAEDIRATPHTATWSRVESEANTVLEDLFYGRVDRDEGVARLIESTSPLLGGSP